jgi:putative ATP-dependent endonuclease of OLD family
MNILIDKVRIKNFRSLNDVEVNLQPMTLLVGANNSGKTTFLQALNIALGVNKKQLTKDDLFINQNGETEQNEIIIDLRIIPINESGERVDKFEREWIGIFNTNAQTDEFGSFFAFRTLVTFKENSDKYETNCYFISNWENPNPQTGDTLTSSARQFILLYFLDAQRDLEQDSKLRGSYFGRLAVQLEKDYEKNKKEEITLLVKELNDKTIEGSKVLSHLKDELSKLNQTTNSTGEGVSLSPFPLKIRDLHKGMKVNFQDNGSDTFGMEYHGMGTRSWASILSFGAFIKWEAEENQNKQGYFPILALEEPEAHLHPNAQRTLYQQLKGIYGQKIVSTHSPYVVGQANLEEYLFFTKKEDTVITSAIENVSEMKAHEQQAMSRFVIDARGEILFSRLVVLAEGETEERFLNLLAQKYFENFYGLSINIIGCGGSNYKYFIKILQAANIPFLVFSDYDNNETRTKVNGQLTACGLDSNNCDELIDLGEDIENYLITAGYENELRQAANLFIPVWFSRENIRERERNRITTNEGLSSFLKTYKTKLAPIYGKILLELNDGRQFPPKILELFIKINTILNINNETGTI